MEIHHSQQRVQLKKKKMFIQTINYLIFRKVQNLYSSLVR